MNHALYDVDLAFIVDTTGSMGAFIDAARRQMVSTLQAVAGAAGTPVNLRLAVVEYRDHPPQDKTFVARAHGFDGNLKRVQKVIDGLKADGGGDAPEAVFDGLRAAAEELDWRPHACRLAVLIGDSPPHGVGAGGDQFAKGCPCGLTAESASALLEAKGITLHALGLTRSVDVSFGKLSAFCGGGFFPAGQGAQAVEAVKEVVARELHEIDFDRQVLELCRATPAWNVDGLGEALASGRGRVASSLSRLGRRGFFNPGAGGEPEAEVNAPSEGRLKRAARSIGRALFGASE